MIKLIRKVLIEHIAVNRRNYLFLLAAFVLGVSSGAFTVNGLSEMQRNELTDYFHGFLQLMKNQDVESSELFAEALPENMKLVGILWILGVTIIGIPFIFLALGVRGFITGFSSGFLISAMGIRGVLFAGFALLPKEILVVPCLVAIGVNGINFSMRIAKNKTDVREEKLGLKPAFISYCLVTLFFSCVILAGVVLEAYLTPVLLRMAAPVIAF